jgi:nucleoside-diphosphate-sugar epimerase
MRSVLITGANGFIGSHLCDAFAARGYAVHGLVRRTSDLSLLEGSTVHLVYGDLTSIDAIDFPPRIDIVVHAAALVSDTAGAAECRRHILDATRSLVEKITRLYPRLSRFVYVSSALTLGYGADDISEEAPGRSADYLPYCRMKKLTEQLLRDRHGETGFPVVILRPGDVYGPRDRTSCRRMLDAAAKGAPLIVGRGSCRFGLCSPTNLSRAALAAVERPGAIGNAYTVVNGVAPTYREFFGALQAGVGRRQRFYVPVTPVLAAALFLELARRLIPGLEPPINFYRIRRITTQTTYDMRRTLRDLGYLSDDDYKAQFRAIVEWYLGETRRPLA